MAYKNFVAGEEALAVDVNSYLMSQTVSRFTNATQRTAQLTAPVTNQLTVLDDRPGQVQYWNGSAWVDLVTPYRDPVLHQWGSTIATTNGYGWITIPLPQAFADVSYRAVAINGDVSTIPPLVYSFWVGVLAGGKYVNSFAVGASFVSTEDASDGSVPVANTSIRVDWIATGPRP